jgi:hypothetical protein
VTFKRKLFATSSIFDMIIELVLVDVNLTLSLVRFFEHT